MPFEGADPAVAEDSLYFVGEAANTPRIFRVPKTELWSYPEEQTQVYHILQQEPIGKSSSANNGYYIGRDIPFDEFTDFRIGVTVDGQMRVSLLEDAKFGTSIANFDNGNERFQQDFTSGTTLAELNDAPNGGFSLDLFEMESASRVTTSLFVQCSR